MSIYKDISNNIKKIVVTKNRLNIYKNDYDELMRICYWARSVKEAVYCMLNGIEEPPKCKLDNCSLLPPWKLGLGYNQFCCRRHSLLDTDRQLIQYSEDVQHKRRITNLERYGVEYTLQSEIVKEKKNNTNIERYGFINPLQNEIIKEKAKVSNLKKYGVENVFQSDEIKEKIKTTMIERYGVENCQQNKEIYQKSRDTMIERYGVPWALQNPEIFSKNNKSRYRLKKYKTIDGNVIEIMGYEGYAYDFLVSRGHSILNGIETIPRIKYINKRGKLGVYYPDLYDREKDIFYEVKCLYTLKVTFERYFYILKSGIKLHFLIYLDAPNKNDPIIITSLDEYKKFCSDNFS